MKHVRILEAVQELPFPVGKSTLVELVTGAVTKKMVTNTTYMDLAAYGSLEMPAAEASRLVDRLVREGYLRIESPADKPYWKLLALTGKGLQEIREPTLEDKRFTASYDADAIGPESRKLIAAFSEYLSPYNEEQQHAIVCPERRVLCVAGAGSGKTTVLTRRIEFLTRFRGVDPKDVLAITFTRKARAEMQERLQGIPATITTFNGLCERVLRDAGRQLPIITYRQKMQLFHESLRAAGLELRALIHEYFTRGQRHGSTNEELAQRLMRDVFGLIDHYANEDEEIPDHDTSTLATTLLRLARSIEEAMEKRGVRDYSGQLRDALALLREHPGDVPRYAHILVDEYQDVNVAQERLLDTLSPKNLFVVGDPRQSIYGWRGAQIRYINEFRADVTVQLRTNYRSDKSIIDAMNKTIAPMNLPDLVGASAEEGVVQTMSFESEDDERKAVATILASLTHDDVYVLARTHQQLQELSAVLTRSGVAHSLRDERTEDDPKGLVLSTVHAIKGLEARTVIVMGVSTKHFPIRVSDHPIIDLLKDPGFDKEEEELRLLYVALSRAKKELFITWSGTQSYFLDRALEKPAPAKKRASNRDDASFERLRSWRRDEAAARGLPAYCICTDKALRALTEERPQTLHELGRVPGIGAKTVQEYGEELLERLHG